ncbi:MAG: response regulator [Candidatus Omnitrophica bacterium]|nr:response regulator [Candidatus Omnitrophota bacterium]
MPNLKILLVDDEEDFRKILGVRLKGWGYDVIEADSGKVAIDMVVHQEPNIIILDFLMPDMDGAATLKEIRKFNSKIPVIMFTAHLHEKTIEEVRELGVSAFVPKISAYTDTIAALQAALKMVDDQSHNTPR